MLQNDYIMRMIMDLIMTIRKVYNLPGLDKDDDIDDIEQSIANAVNIDRELLFSLEPESMVTMMEVGEVTDELAQYVTRAMFIEVKMLEADEKLNVAALRRQQAIAVAEHYGCSIPDHAISAEGLMREFIEVDGEMEQAKKVEPAAKMDGSEAAAEMEQKGTIGGISVDLLKFDD